MRCYIRQRKSEWRISRNNSPRFGSGSRAWTASTRTPTSAAASGRAAPTRPGGQFIEELLSGEVVNTAASASTSKPRSSGSATAATAASTSPTSPTFPRTCWTRSRPAPSRSAHPTRWAFLDTETTGLAGGTGTYAFLIGVGSIDASGFRLRQFFMRDYGEEASLLYRLAEYLAQFDVLITYNGKSYDQPLLETRFRMARARHPFDRMQHLDLLFGARRLWKLRLESCRLVDLENRILGVEREGDLPGEMIPYVLLRFPAQPEGLPGGPHLPPQRHRHPVAGLPDRDRAVCLPLAGRARAVRHGADLIGLARWLHQSERQDEALRLFRRALEMGLPDDLCFAPCGMLR